MEGRPVDEYDAEEILDAVESQHQARVAAECRLLELAVQFAIVNNAETVPDNPRRLPGRQRAVRLGGEGTPTVAEFAAAELGARMQLGPFAAKMLIADGLDCCFRLPRLWAQVRAHTARVSLVRYVAQATRHLSKAAAAKVDAAVAALADGRLPRARFERVVDAQVVSADPETAARREEQAAASCHARASRSTEQGMKSFTLRATAPTVIRFDATVAYLAHALAALGDPDNEDARRVKACLILANPAHAVQLLAAFAAHRATTAAPDGRPDPGPADGSGNGDGDVPAKDTKAAGTDRPDTVSPLCRPRPFRPDQPMPPLHQLATSGGYRFTPEKLLPTVTVYLHLSQQDLIRDANGVARFEGGDPVTHDFVRTHLAPFQTFTITGVIDLAHQAPADAYELPPEHRTAVKLLSPADAFPFATALVGDTKPGFDTDHNRPYHRDGPPGQSRLDNYAPLARFHHRIKTFGAWTVRQPFPGIWIWRDPHGHHYLVDHTGTRTTTGPPTPAPGSGGPHDHDLDTQVWDATLRPALDFTFAHCS